MDVQFAEYLETVFTSYQKDEIRILLGFRCGEKILVTECVNHYVIQGKNDEETKKNVISFFPAGIEVLGYLTKSFEINFKNVEYLIDAGIRVLVCHDENEISCMTCDSNYDKNSDKFSPKFISNVEILGEIFNNYFLFNAKSSHSCQFNEGSDLKNAFISGVKTIERELNESNLRFIAKKEKPILFSPDSEKPIKDLCKSEDNFDSKKFFQKKAIFKPEITDLYNNESIKVHPYTKSCTEGNVPCLRVNQSAATVHKLLLKINAFAFVPKISTASDVCKSLKCAMLKQLNCVELCYQNLELPTKILEPQIMNFISQSGILFNVTYPANMSDTECTKFRHILHQFFITKTDKPLYTKLNAVDLLSISTPCLVNTHIGLKPPDTEGGKLHLVHGCYSYHHYMQDRIDDNGWGCAYRSLQTIVSWFRHQGYTGKPVPTHREIQESLVTIGDKPKKFIGSRLWIGSIEVSNVLSNYLDITSKIMSLSRGSEMESRGRELAYHFDTIGTPIMIGGGVLAHTILGVCFSEVTGETHFLILDPHYTGTDDLKTIQSKGWCGWKDNDFWDKNAFYNLCLPQKPDCF